ncbi:BPSL0761 family protein [Pseudomonas profundi]|uniref:BPSL0761 family protein n=1 Tax=Pseudomonas profundi TaxID=1981513 RepID=UPI001238A965|nr:BPSL0761 family protein [Pseudomonas profundi]
MTMPDERTRSIIQTREFLIALHQNKSLPESVRDQAYRLLRHYPTAEEVLLAGKKEESRGEGLMGRFLSSSFD